jgi:uncharacterized lipoprotein YmbA
MRTCSRATARHALLLTLVLLGAAGCFRLSRNAPTVRQYVLGGPSAAAGAAHNGSTAAGVRPGLTVGLRRLDLASYLAVPAIVMRRGANELDRSEFHRWGENLDLGINRVVGAYLAGMPPVRAVDVAPWSPRTRHDFILQLHVSRFEGVADGASGGRVHLLAGWDIIRPIDGLVLVRGTTEDREGRFSAGDYSAIVTGLDAALARVAREISGCLAGFRNDSTPPARCGSGGGGVGAP